MTKNEIILVKALADKNRRKTEGLFVAEGEKLVYDLVAAGMEAQKIFIVNENCSYIEMNRISHLKTPTKILGLFKIPTPTPPNTNDCSLILVLDGIQDPGNMGTIIRTAEWFGVQTIYCSAECADCYSPKVVQATMGAIAHVKMVYTDLIPLLEQVTRPIYGTMLLGADNIYSADLSGGGYVVMGSEGRGLSAEVQQLLTKKIYIPRSGCGESLNVAAATAVVLSEFARQGAVQ